MRLTDFRIIYQMIDLNANHINIKPPKISRIFDGNFLKKFPHQNPQIDIMKVITPIITDGLNICIPEKNIDAPAASASMLVAIEIATKHFIDMQEIASCFSSKASF